MHTQFEKCAYVRNHGQNNMGCGHAPQGGACPHKGIPLHFQTYLFFVVGIVLYLLALWIYYNGSLWSPSISILTLVVPCTLDIVGWTLTMRTCPTSPMYIVEQNDLLNRVIFTDAVGPSHQECIGVLNHQHWRGGMMSLFIQLAQALWRDIGPHFHHIGPTTNCVDVALLLKDYAIVGI